MPPTTDQGKAVSDIGAASSAAVPAIQLLQGALNGMFDMLRDRSDEIGKITSGLGGLVLANEIYSSALYNTAISGMEKAARVPRAIAAEIAGGNILAGTALNEQAKILFEDATRTQTELLTKEISFGLDASGQEIKRSATLLYKNSVDLNKAYAESVLKESSLYSAGIKALNKANAYDMKESTDLAMRGLGLDAAAVRQIYEREYANTGEITGKYIENFSATIIAGEKLTGLSKKALTEDVSRMLADFNMYGRYSESQMIVLSKTVHDLGIDLATASESAQKFMSFEGATQAAANVAALTGVVIDSQKMFYLSNTDQAAFMTEQRRILQEMNFDSYDPVTKNALAAELGFKNTADALAVMHSQLDATGKVAADTIAMAAKAKENTGEALDVQLRLGSAIDTLRAMKPEELRQSEIAIKDLAGGTEQLAIAIETFNNKLMKTSSEVAPVMVTAGKEVSDAFSKGLSTASEIITKLQDGTADFFKSGGFMQVVDSVHGMLNGASKAIKESPVYPQSMPPAWAQILVGVKLFKDQLNIDFDAIIKDLSSKLDQMANAAKEKGKLKAELELETSVSEAASSTNSSVNVAAPVAPAVSTPTAAPAPAMPVIEATNTPVASPLTATADIADMKIKVHVEFNDDKMNDIIDARVQEIITGHITFKNPVDSRYSPGMYRIRFEEANK